MRHTQQDLNRLWDEVQSGRLATKANVVRPLAAPGSFDVLPEIVVSDSALQVLSVPIKDNADRAVYARKVGGAWVEVP
jgi:hypothetical protein